MIYTIAIHFELNTFKNNMGCLTSIAPVHIMCLYNNLEDSPTTGAYSHAFLSIYTSKLNISKSVQQTQIRTQYNNSFSFTTASANSITMSLSKTLFISNQFINNYGMISSALLIHGAKDIVVNNNTFQNNGILISDVVSAASSLYYKQIYGLPLNTPSSVMLEVSI